MSERPDKDYFLADPEVEAAMVSLMDAIDAARARRKLKPGKSFAVVSIGTEESGVASTGCKCPPCRVKMISTLSKAFGMNVHELDLSAAADAARAVH